MMKPYNINLNLKNTHNTNTGIEIPIANRDSVIFNIFVHDDAQEINYTEYSKALVIFRKNNNITSQNTCLLTDECVICNVKSSDYDVPGLVFAELWLYIDDVKEVPIPFNFKAIQSKGYDIAPSESTLDEFDNLLKDLETMKDEFPNIRIIGESESEEQLNDLYPDGADGSVLVGNDVYYWNIKEKVWINIGALRGEKGEEGIQGAKGEKGDKGEQGIQGIQGEQGIKGEKGEKGDTGAQGDIGAQGEQGLQGEKGDTGDTGAQGIQGVQGEQGIKGDTGAQGERGIQGIQGDTGAQGEKGEKGDIGAQGVKGDDGKGVNVLGSYSSAEELRQAHPTGQVSDAYLVQGDLWVWSETENNWANAGTIQGAKGEKGDTGTQGEKGDTGAQGEQGIQGIQGEQGAQGEKGDTGAQGEKGDTGAQGEQGIQGIQGDTGLQGEKGDKGEAGTKGDTGAQGEQGIQGIQGEQGFQGIQGVQGIQGAKGDKGEPAQLEFTENSVKYKWELVVENGILIYRYEGV